MLLSLDQFVFSLQTAPFRELQRQRNWKHAASARVGARDASQFTGAGDDTITLNGMVAEDNAVGTIASLDKLATMGDTGDAYVLVDGSGAVYGAFVIESLNETATYHSKDGRPRKIEFNLTVKRVDDTELSKAATAAAAAKDAGKATVKKASTALAGVKEITKVAGAMVTAARSLNTANAFTAATSVVGGLDSVAAAMGVQGLSEASGIQINAAINGAKDLVSLTRQPLSSAVADVFNRAVGK
ncbi:phage tail protein [Burkholderia plantarii]|nr:phage tail protein [Burkholderia plantarii]WLE59289.1 phage tail protein [Burkholderia plantarii]